MILRRCRRENFADHCACVVFRLQQSVNGVAFVTLKLRCALLKASITTDVLRQLVVVEALEIVPPALALSLGGKFEQLLRHNLMLLKAIEPQQIADVALFGNSMSGLQSTDLGRRALKCLSGLLNRVAGDRPQSTQLASESAPG